MPYPDPMNPTASAEARLQTIAAGQQAQIGELNKKLGEARSIHSDGAQAALYGPTGRADATRGQLQQMANSSGLVNVDDSVQQNARLGQNSLAATLAAQAAGQGTSAAQIQQQQGTQQAILAQQAAAATGGNSTNPFLLQRQLAQQGAAMQQQGVAQGSLLRAQETQAAQQALGNIYNQQGQLGLQAHLASAQLGQQRQQFGLSGLQATDTRDAQARLALGGANLEAELQNARLNAGQVAQERQIDYQDRRDFTGALIGGVTGLATAGATLASDERAKENVDRDTDSKLDDFMGALDRASYDYKDPGKFGQGRHWGIMAQSAERTEAGRSMVDELPDGTKALDMRKALGLALASVSRLDDRQRRTEKLLARAQERLA